MAHQTFRLGRKKLTLETEHHGEHVVKLYNGHTETGIHYAKSQEADAVAIFDFFRDAMLRTQTPTSHNSHL